MNQMFSLSVELRFPELFPQAVMYAVVEWDARPTYIEYVGKLENGYVAANLQVSKSLLLCTAWDKLFDKVSGAHIYVAVPMAIPKITIDPVSGQKNIEVKSTTIIISDDGVSQMHHRWLISRAFEFNGKAIAWYLPIEGKPEARNRIVLTEETAIDLALVL
jgi:hypothetical protein